MQAVAPVKAAVRSTTSRSTSSYSSALAMARLMASTSR